MSTAPSMTAPSMAAPAATAPPAAPSTAAAERPSSPLRAVASPPVFRAVEVDPVLRRAARHEGGAAPVAALECVEAGELGGVRWEPGMRAAAVPGVLDGDAVVLLPRGRGRPMAGRLAEGHLLGAWGERCHPLRWEVAGRLVGPFRRAGRRWAPSVPRQPSLFAAA